MCRGYLIDIPWFGDRRWENMYDWPAHKTSRQHLPLNSVWQACLAEQKLEHNNHVFDDSICGVYQEIDVDDKRIVAYNKAIPKADDFVARARIGRPLLEGECAGHLDTFEKMNADELAKLQRRIAYYLRV